MSRRQAIMAEMRKAALRKDGLEVEFGEIEDEAGEVEESLVDSLKTLLADTVSLYHEAHGFHWNVKGQDFSQYHALFESVYSDLYESIDEIAEDLLKLGVDAPFQLSDIMAMRSIEEARPADTPQEMATELLSGMDALLETLNDAFEAATRENQQGIANFVAERIDMTQKWQWQLRSSTGLQTGTMG